MNRTLMLITLVACGGSSETPVEEVTYGDDTVVEGQTDLEKLHALFDAEIAALRTLDVEAMIATHALDADSFMLGPVDVAVMEGGEMIEATIRRVLGGSEPADVNATEHVFEVVGDSAYSAHTVQIGPESSPELTYHSVQLYKLVADAWRVAASSWTVALPNERAIEMAAAGALPESAPIPDRRDPGCEAVADDIASLRADGMPPAERVVGSFSLGTAPEEAGPFTQQQYDAITAALASDGFQSAAGPGGVYARRVGALCYAVTAIDRIFEHEGNPTTLRLRAFVVSDPQTPTHAVGSFSLVLPQRPAEPTTETTEAAAEPVAESTP